MLIALLSNAGLAYAAQAANQTGSATDRRDIASKPNDLRGLYQIVGDPASSNLVGRLTLQHIVDGIPQEVSRHHRFRSGDRFNFLVSANRAGWLYVLHRTGDGPVQQLWPQDSGTTHGGQANRLRPHMAMQVPPPGVAFAFDEEVGMEHFYVTIVSKPRPPSLTVMTVTDVNTSAEPDHPPPRVQPDSPPSRPEVSPAATPLATASATGPKILQFSVRGPGASLTPMRGVVLDPDPQESDPATYFSLLPQDQDDTLVFEFRLLHEQ